MLGAYAAARRGAMLVVPTAQDARHYTARAGRRGGGAGLGADVRRAGGGDRAAGPTTRAGGCRRCSASGCWSACSPQLSFDALRASAAAAGFAAAAGELIAELQRELITPQRFAAALRAWSAQDVRRAPYAHDVGRDLLRLRARARPAAAGSTASCIAWRALDALRAAPARWGARPGLLLRLRRPDRARARRDRDAGAGRRRRRSPSRSPTSRAARRCSPARGRSRSCARSPSR